MATFKASTFFEAMGNINPNTYPAIVPAIPGLAEKDLVVVAAWHAQALAASGTLTAPAGMQRISPQGVTPARLMGVFVIVVEDPADFASGFLIGGTTASSRVVGTALAYSPAAGKKFDLSLILSSDAEWVGTAATENLFPAMDAATLRLTFTGTNKSATTVMTTHTPGGGGTLRAFGISRGDANASTADSALSAVENGDRVTYNTSQANAVQFGITAQEMDESSDPDPLPVVTGHGFVSVQQMLETPGATSAHRALGGTYPEMTEYGARMAANLGHGLIEISAQRDADGTWWCSHDPTLDRVILEGSFDGQQISSLTTAQLTGLQVNVATSGGPKPFVTVEQLVETLPEDFIFALDAKQSGGTPSLMTEFLDLCDLLLGPDRCIIKVDGASTPGRLQAAQARGYKTMAYYYGAPATPTPQASVLNNLPYVDLPGLNWDATVEEWEKYTLPGGIYYTGRPMWGHVVTSQAQADQATARGARIIQATTTAITPVGVEAWVPPAPEDSIIGVWNGTALVSVEFLGVWDDSSLVNAEVLGITPIE